MTSQRVDGTVDKAGRILPDTVVIKGLTTSASAYLISYELLKQRQNLRPQNSQSVESPSVWRAKLSS